MLVVGSYHDVPAAARGAVLTIGNFDGVHRGHQAVIAKTRATAATLKAPAGVMLFDPHPRAFFKPEPPLFTLTPMEQRLELLAALGLDFAAVLPFDAALAGLSATDFVAKVLVGGFAARHVVVGHDFCFGKGRTGNRALLEAEGRRLGFGVNALEPLADGQAAFSSSRVREALAAGKVDEAALLLGRPWRIDGIVISGAGRGAGLGYPTANIALPPGTELALGIYAALAWVDGVSHPAVAYLGKRPVFDGGKPGFEVFLIDFDGDLYGKCIRIDMVSHIRGDRNFDSIEALKSQMDHDVAAALTVLGLDAVRP
jgi:riboflavin kinase / FMN adenylyltransferase